MHLIHTREICPSGVGPKIFLAGPSPRTREVASWRPEALRLLRELGYTGCVFVPEWPAHLDPEPEYDKNEIAWEWANLEQSDAIVFWIPRNLVTLPGFTTNVEFGLYCRSGKALLGFPPGAPKMRYLELLALANNVPVFHDLGELLRATLARLTSAQEKS